MKVLEHAAAGLFFMISYRCHAMAWEHCLVYSCFTTNREDPFHILTVQVALETGSLAPDVTRRASMCIICPLPRTARQ